MHGMELKEMHGMGADVTSMIASVSRLLHLEEIELPEEFFPAHLTVALIDAVVRSTPGTEEIARASAEKYCDRFGLARRRSDRWELPSVYEQDSLSDLIRRYDDIGMDGMTEKVFPTGQYLPDTNLSAGEAVLQAARALTGINVEILQDVQTCQAEEIEGALHQCSGTNDSTARMLLMYTGDDDFVREDECIRKFVARAVGRSTVPVKRAVKLVRQSAYELILAPRFLDREIWRCSSHYRSSHAGIQTKGTIADPRVRITASERPEDRELHAAAPRTHERTSTTSGAIAPIPPSGIDHAFRATSLDPDLSPG